MVSAAHIHYMAAEERHRARIATCWGEVAARHMHIADGFSLLAMDDDNPVGLIAVQWRALPPPFSPGVVEGFIDIVEVRPEFRRRGIATVLLERSAKRAYARGAYQLRAWSSEDRTEALLMWQALDFGLCPATTFPQGQAVNGYFVARILRSD